MTTTTKSKTDVETVALSPRRPTYFVSILPDGTAVGWDQCGTCTLEIQTCDCSKPTPPGYVLGMLAREKAAAETLAKAAKVKQPTATTPEDDTATEVENPDEALAEAVDELVEESA